MPTETEQKIREDPSGWFLPTEDTYFLRFVEGPPRKNGFMRHHLLEAFRYVRSWEVAVDVGAHVGFWCWDLAQRFKTVFAFEPMQTNYECLRKNMAGFDNVIFHNKAVGSQAMACHIRNDSARIGNTGSCYVVPDPYGDTPMVALNQMRLPGCDLLKIDVEGYELQVLQGASKLIKEHWPVVIMECSDDKFHRRFGTPIGEAERWLLRRGYREMAYMRPDKVFVRAS